MSYKPNIHDPRIQRRIKKAIGFTNSFLSDVKPRGWSTRYIDKFFGQQQNELSMWLRSKLLICTNDRYSKDSGICKEYIKNQIGIDELVSLLKSNTLYPSVLQVGTITQNFIEEEFKLELESKNFKYEDKSGRLWHNLQRVKREHKLIVLGKNGLKHNYDIQCCAPTLLHQYSQMLDDPMDLYLNAINRYIKNRTQVRHELANNAEITYDEAKTIINALFNGAHISKSSDSDIYKLLNGDIAKIEYLKQDPYIIELRSDIKIIWDYIKQTLPVTIITDKNNKQRTKPISSNQKSGVYFDLERKVLNSVVDYLDMSNNKYFLEHDGWVCTNEIDMGLLSKWIRDKTGFNINLEYSFVS